MDTASGQEFDRLSLTIDLAAMAEEAGRDFIHLFRRYSLELEPRTFLVTYLACLCSQAGLDGEQVLGLLVESGRLEAMAAELAALR